MDKTRHELAAKEMDSMRYNDESLPQIACCEAAQSFRQFSPCRRFFKKGLISLPEHREKSHIDKSMAFIGIDHFEHETKNRYA